MIGACLQRDGDILGCTVCMMSLWQAGCSVLMSAISNEQTAVALALVDRGAIVNIQAKNGSTALMLACQDGSERVAEALLSHGADATMQDCVSCSSHYSSSALSFHSRRDNLICIACVCVYVWLCCSGAGPC